jgi:hypothetical protein
MPIGSSPSPITTQPPVKRPPPGRHRGVVSPTRKPVPTSQVQLPPAIALRRAAPIHSARSVGDHSVIDEGREAGLLLQPQSRHPEDEAAHAFCPSASVVAKPIFTGTAIVNQGHVCPSTNALNADWDNVLTASARRKRRRHRSTSPASSGSVNDNG